MVHQNQPEIPENPVADEIQAKVGAHHDEHLGPQSLYVEGLMLAKHAGQVAAAIVLYEEKRGRGTKADIADAMSKVMVCMLGLSHHLGFSLSQMTDSGVEDFFARTWPHLKRD